MVCAFPFSPFLSLSYHCSYSLSRRTIIQGNGISYLPEIVLSHDSMGQTFQARRVTRQYSAYSVDPLSSPVAIRSLLKVLPVSTFPR